jgi:PAS domain S-box-containing protein
MKRFLWLFKDSFIGPIVMISIVMGAGLYYIIPTLSKKYAKEQSVEQSERLVDHIRTFRSYYNDHILSKIRANTDLGVNYDHASKDDVVPLPATTVHELGELFTQGGKISVNMYSNYPFPNRADRILDGYQKRSLDYLLKHPHEIYTEYDPKKRQYRTAFPDFLSAQGCVSCHNTRADTPRADWKLGDVRGVIEVSMSSDAMVGSSQELTYYVMLFVAANLFVLIVHYSLLSYRRSKQLKEENASLEEQVHERTKELTNKNQLLSEYKKAVDEGAIVSKTDPLGKITYVNSAFESISGYKQEELLGKNHNIVRHPDTPNELFEDLWSTIKAQKVWHGEIKNRAKHGQSYYVSATIGPIVDENGETVEYIAIRYDTTLLHQAIAEARDAEKAKGQFLANMSHELRTPLNAIIGFSQILQHRKVIPDVEMGYIDKILLSGQNLLHLVNTILDFSKIEEGKMEYFPSTFFIASMMREIKVLVETQAAEKSLDLMMPSLDENQEIYGDMQLLKQTFLNLLSNAIKFTPENGRVSVNYYIKDGSHHFSVCDTGKGIAKKDVKTLFDPFKQGSDAAVHATKGTGLGLAITKRIVTELHLGKIWVESEEGSGSCFYVTIPVNLEERQTSQS